MRYQVPAVGFMPASLEKKQAATSREGDNMQ